ncbi:MAG: hypothetical protein ACI8O8_001811, partial [Oleiphilaceae bacterium]
KIKVSNIKRLFETYVCFNLLSRFSELEIYTFLTFMGAKNKDN